MYILKIQEPGKPPEIRQYTGELTDEVRQQWRRVLKFSKFKYELLPYVGEKEEKGVKCQKMKL